MRNSACTEETLRKETLKNEDVEVIYTSCDTLAKDESISVYLLKSGSNNRSGPMRWLNRKTLVFKYDPAMVDAPLPVVQEGNDGAISISVARVSSVMVQGQTWKEQPVHYEIGQIDYR